jgi:hypothetical protein
MASSSTLPTRERYLPIDLIDEARLAYTTGLPPFIQTNLDLSILPGYRHEVILKTKTGSFPSIKSTKKAYLVCRAWEHNNRNRFWTYDYSNVRYIVKAFPTHAQPADVPKISYHVWEGVGRNFQKTRVAYDADEKLYRTHHANKAIRKGFGSTDLNKGFRAFAEYLEYAEVEKENSKRRKISKSIRHNETLFRPITSNKAPSDSPGEDSASTKNSKLSISM